ncbi:MAG: tRNA uridine-5-carboxymethylaminomethyl(34) synthesis enzyme MnmG [Firmicutes bacterium]|nr:tRNA uridine-5-carboxymethylaminomethyl(34) synthesis enzyme MnmG [Bacillota bacterium]
MTYPASDFDVVVVGLGHSGVEAALAAARLGCRTLAVSTSLENTAFMACNPSVGVPPKAHLVREIDALGGEMARAIDATFLQMRLLNTGKGPAVQALRAQADKRAYQAYVRRVLERQEGLYLRQAAIDAVLADGGSVAGVRTKTGIEYGAKAVVLATGTFLEGRVITGEHAFASGPSGQLPAQGLSANLRSLGLRLGRFKTGTPPRVDGRTVDLSRLKEQPGDEVPRRFSYLSEAVPRAQLSCWLTYTGEETHRLIRRNLHRAPLYTGAIEGAGPRYCPSVEDKVVRFSDKPRHQVFLEPEGWNTNEMYVQGLSTSLPEDVQWEVLRSVPGLERAEMLRPGYAIEYDCLLPRQLELSLQVRGVPGLFGAGQLNGSSGYEEAAAQGLVAGVNAARWSQGLGPWTMDRSEGYIGVLVDDLVTKGVTEPYRVLTSRAEYRLSLRQSNADLRLTEKGRQLGLVDDERYRRFQERAAVIERARTSLREVWAVPGSDVARWVESCGAGQVKGPVNMEALLRRPGVEADQLAAFVPELASADREAREEVALEVKYEGYLRREGAQVAQFRRLEDRRLPPDLDYGSMAGLSTEARVRLAEVRPLSLGQAQRLEGVSPADIAYLLVYLGQHERTRVGQEGGRVEGA